MFNVFILKEEAYNVFLSVCWSLCCMRFMSTMNDQFKAYLRNYCQWYRGYKLDERIFEKILSLDIEYFEEHQTGTVMKYMSDLRKTRELQREVLDIVNLFCDIALKLYYICMVDASLLKLSAMYFPIKIIFDGIRSQAG